MTEDSTDQLQQTLMQWKYEHNNQPRGNLYVQQPNGIDQIKIHSNCQNEGNFNTYRQSKTQIDINSVANPSTTISEQSKNSTLVESFPPIKAYIRPAKLMQQNIHQQAMLRLQPNQTNPEHTKEDTIENIIIPKEETLHMLDMREKISNLDNEENHKDMDPEVLVHDIFENDDDNNATHNDSNTMSTMSIFAMTMEDINILKNRTTDLNSAKFEEKEKELLQINFNIMSCKTQALGCRHAGLHCRTCFFLFLDDFVLSQVTRGAKK